MEPLNLYPELDIDRSRIEGLLVVDFFFMPTDLCECSRKTYEALEAALPGLQKLADARGLQLQVNRYPMDNEMVAWDYEVPISPTIRVNWVDLSTNLHEARCDSCSDVCGVDSNCRRWRIGSELLDAPTPSFIVQRATEILDNDEQPIFEGNSWKLPFNLKKYYVCKYRKACNEALFEAQLEAFAKGWPPPARVRLPIPPNRQCYYSYEEIYGVGLFDEYGFDY